MQVEALVFDAYGTLYDVHAVERRCEHFWPGRGAELSRLWRAKQLEYTWLRSLTGRYAPFSTVTREALEYACEALKLALKPSQAGDLMADYMRLATYPDAAEALRRLRGFKTAILSNGSPDILLPLVESSGLKLDAVISVDELKVFKPAPAVYGLAVARLGIPKEKIGFVSANGWDANGAKSFGFSAYWINRTGAPVERLGFEPDAVLATLGELPEVLP